MINGRGQAPRGHRGARRRDNHGVNGRLRLDKPTLIAANPPVTPAVRPMKMKTIILVLVQLLALSQLSYGAEKSPQASLPYRSVCEVALLGDEDIPATTNRK